MWAEVQALLTITGRRLAGLRAQVGHFYLWRFLVRGHWLESHPLSLSAAPDGRSLRITVKGMGDFSGKIAQEVRPGTRVVAERPFGAFTTAIRRRDEDVVFRGELDRIAAERGARVEYLGKILPDIRKREVYLCRSPAVTDAIEKTVRSVGVPRRSLHVERFAL